MIKSILLAILLMGCTVTTIRINNHDGSTCTVDASISANPEIDPNLDVPLTKPATPK